MEIDHPLLPNPILVTDLAWGRILINEVGQTTSGPMASGTTVTTEVTVTTAAIGEQTKGEIAFRTVML